MVESVTQTMKWTSALSTQPSLEAAIREVSAQAQAQLQASPDLALVFISTAFASEFSRLMPLLQQHLAVPVLIGCGGGGVIGVDGNGDTREVEGEAALSLTLAHLPGVEVRSFHLSMSDLPDLDSPPSTWSSLVGVAPEAQPQFILLADPGSAGIVELLQGLDFAYPTSVKVGGLASVGATAGMGGLFHNFDRHEEGLVGLALTGNIVLDAIVAQGCRPIGQPFRVTEAERNIVLKVEDCTEAGEACSLTQSPLEALQAIFQTLDEDDRALAQHSLFVGVAQSAFKQTLEAGDFLVRNLLGVDPKSGAIAVGDRVRPGQRIQFHLRDAETSAEDLQILLEKYRNQSEPSPIGALMFACLGRGEGLYDEPNFDSGLFGEYFRRVPVSGFFCNGEIGPVSGSTFLHGYTSVFGICRPAQV